MRRYIFDSLRQWHIHNARTAKEYTKKKNKLKQKQQQTVQFFNMSIVYGKNKHTNLHISIELKKNNISKRRKKRRRTCRMKQKNIL